MPNTMIYKTDLRWIKFDAYLMYSLKKSYQNFDSF